MTSRLQIQSQPSACHDDALAGLREILRVTRSDADVERIQRAYDVAASWHHGQTRRSGDPYITHPLAVATILAETGADDEMLCAALLHDTIEDTLVRPGESRGPHVCELVPSLPDASAL
jgi:guanosine-3',5'-bis(diphosphate) 3'-pyrophosphohydrolase